MVVLLLLLIFRFVDSFPNFVTLDIFSSPDCSQSSRIIIWTFPNRTDCTKQPFGDCIRLTYVPFYDSVNYTTFSDENCINSSFTSLFPLNECVRNTPSQLDHLYLFFTVSESLLFEKSELKDWIATEYYEDEVCGYPDSRRFTEARKSGSNKPDIVFGCTDEYIINPFAFDISEYPVGWKDSKNGYIIYPRSNEGNCVFLHGLKVVYFQSHSITTAILRCKTQDEIERIYINNYTSTHSALVRTDSYEDDCSGYYAIFPLRFEICINGLVRKATLTRFTEIYWGYYGQDPNCNGEFSYFFENELSPFSQEKTLWGGCNLAGSSVLPNDGKTEVAIYRRFDLSDDPVYPSQMAFVRLKGIRCGDDIYF